MLDDQDNIFDVPHSLPSNSHMSALATRTPSGPSKVNSNKYMPDYGGIIEIPGTKTKRTGLRVGIPFETNPYYVRVESDSDKPKSLEPRGRDCLIAAPYLKIDGENDFYRSDTSFSTIRAVDRTLYLDLVNSIPCNPTPLEIHKFTTYGHVPYSYRISGLKYCDNTEDYVIVKFAQGIKLIKLNNLYRLPSKFRHSQPVPRSDSDTEVDEIDQVAEVDQSAVNSISSFAESQGLEIRDASLSKSQSWLYIASSDYQNLYLKLYDLNTSKQCHKVLVKSRDDDVKIRLEESKKLGSDRKRSLRSFIPSKPSFEELHQIMCDPNHLVNSVMVTSNRVALVDPRDNNISLSYADRFKLMSISPTERFGRVEFSYHNEQQFYLMSDEKLRAMDKRYPSKDMNILNHMIDSIDYDVMNMKLVVSEKTDQETLCLSAYGNLVNPRSMHQPILEPSPIAISGKPTDELYGLAVSADRVFNSKDILFSTLQLSQEGDVCIRGFSAPRDNFLDFEVEPSSHRVLRKSKNLDRPSAIESPANSQSHSDSNSSRVIGPSNEIVQLNVLDSSNIVEFEKRLTTKRALTRYDWMKKKLRR